MAQIQRHRTEWQPVVFDPMKILLLFGTMVFVGCSAILSSLDDGGTELIPGTFYYNPLKATSKYSRNPSIQSAYQTRQAWYDHGLAHSYHFSIDAPRFIRYMHLDTLGVPVKNVEVYTRLTDTDSWKLLKQFKSPVDTTTRIDLNVRASEIRVIQKTVSLQRDADDIIIGFKVYAQKEGLQ